MSQPVNTGYGGFRGRMDGKGKFTFKEDSVMMSYIESATLMWVQRGTPENAKELMELSNQLSQVCPRASIIKQPPLLGKIYGTRFTQDDMWYRCMVRQIASEEKVTVHFIDYGNSEDKNPRDLVEIPNSLTGIRAFAYKTLLHNLSSKDNDQKVAMEYLRSKTEGKLLKVQHTRPLIDGTGYYVHLLVENENLGDEMVKEGLATYRVTNNQTRQKNGKPRAGGKSNTRSDRFAESSNKMDRNGPNDKQVNDDRGGFDKPDNRWNRKDNDSIKNGKSGDTGSESSFGKPANRWNSTDKTRARPQQPANTRFGEWNKVDTDTTRQEHGFKVQLEKEKAEKDMIVLELTNLKGRFLTLQTEYNGMSNRLSDSSTSHKIQMSVNLSDKVHKLRCEFATNDEDDLILAAIAKLNETDKLLLNDLGCLQKMQSAEKHLHDIQAEIKAAGDMEQDRLEDLATQRDSQRKDFCSRIEEFLSVVSKLPLTSRKEKLQSLCSLIEKRYHAFLMFIVNNCPELDQVENQYKTWKAQHIDEFTLVRCETDTHQQTVMQALSKLLSLLCLSVDSPDHDVPNDGELDLDSLLKTATTALQREIVVTNVLHSKDACLLATVIHTLHKTAKSELDDAQEILQIRDKYKVCLTDCHEWVTMKPDLNEIRSVKKETRSLKSKIRHLTADLQDLEETDESKESEKLALKSKLVGLQTDLTTKLDKEEQLLAELTRTCDTHFPEIVHLHKDLSLGSHQDTVDKENGQESYPPENLYTPDSVKAALHYFRKQPGLDDAGNKKPSQKSASVQTSSSGQVGNVKLKTARPTEGIAKVSLLDSPIEAEESGDLMVPLLSQPSPPPQSPPKTDTATPNENDDDGANGDSLQHSQVSAEDAKKINDITAHLMDELLKSLNETGAEYNTKSVNTNDIKEQLVAIFSTHHEKLLENRPVTPVLVQNGCSSTSIKNPAKPVPSQTELVLVQNGGSSSKENPAHPVPSQTDSLLTNAAGDAYSHQCSLTCLQAKDRL